MKRIANYLIAMALVAFTFTSCEDVPNPFGQILPPGGDDDVVVIDPTGSGTQADPFNVQAALDYVNALGADVQSDKEVYIKGYVITVTEQFGAQYGNATFTISDLKEGGNIFTFWRGLYLGNVKWTEGGLTLNEGDEVVICGKVVNYKGTTPETVQANAYVYSINGNTGGDTPTPTPTPTEAKAVSVAEFNAAAESTDVWYQLTGTVKNLKDGDQYGNFDIEDATGSVYVYGLLAEKGGESKKFQELVAAKGIKEGSKITVIGNRGSYTNKNTGETKIEVLNAYFVSIEDGGGDTPSSDVKTVSIADFNAAAESTDVWYQLTGTVKNLKDGDQYGNFDLVDETGSVYVYGVLSEKGGEKKKFQELVAAKGIKEGSKITIIGNRGSYTNKTTGETKIEVLNAYFVSIEDGGTSGGGDTATGADGSTIISVADFNAAAESTDIWYQLTGTIKNLKDGDQYGNFDLEDSTGSVYVYGVLSTKGGEKKKFQELVTAHGIANGKKITIVGNRGSYTNKNTGETKIEVLNAYFIKVE